MQKYFKISSFYLLFGLVMGIFSREFTKLNNFSGYTVLKSVHTHTLVLGFLFFIIVLLLEKNFTISNNKSFNKWIVLYNLGLLYLIITLSIRGILQVVTLAYQVTSLAESQELPLTSVKRVSFGIVNLEAILLPVRSRVRITSTEAATAPLG